MFQINTEDFLNNLFTHVFYKRTNIEMGLFYIIFFNELSNIHRIKAKTLSNIMNEDFSDDEFAGLLKKLLVDWLSGFYGISTFVGH